MGRELTSWGKRGLEEGLEKGLEKGVLKGREEERRENSEELIKKLSGMINQRFGTMPRELESQLKTFSYSELLDFLEHVFQASSLGELEGLWH